uniref:Acetolactate synthase n=1 Tax=Rhizochromulina marina TaxID=1034831 RepID=A0A514CPX8_9STRA|nr:acetolactate synthase 2 large subunit [Rhizochromulina marina]QDH81858.1 acetolactate synthase 2 large subunit [Rhizochromulina marina]
MTLTPTKISKQTGAFALLDSLIRNGTKYIFGYPGGAILPIYDELYRWEKQNLIKHILARHEQGAIHAADGYARATGQVGVCFATSGPGATNLVTGIATAQMDSIPLVIITGQVGRAFIGTDAFQETDIFGITLPIVKHSYVVRDPNQMAQIVAEAFYLAQNGRPGPVLIDIPKDVGLEEFDNYIPVRQRDILKLKGYRFKFRTKRNQIKQVLEKIKESTQPLLYVGGGAVTANAQAELRELAELFQIPITTTLMGKGCFLETHPLSLGMLGMHGTAYANFAVSECDLLIAVGARFDDRVTGKLDDFACHAQVIHIDVDPAEISKNRIPQIALVGDVKIILQAILKEQVFTPDIDVTQTAPWRKRILKWKQTYPLLIPDSQGLSPQEVINTISEISPTAFFTTDVGQHQMWAAQFIKCLPRHWASSAGLGTMGYGLPAAIGIQIAYPNNPVVCITGDSSFQMNIQELGTIAQYKLPIKIIIINNKWQGMVRQWQQSFYGERYSHSNMQAGAPDFSQLANSYGIKSKRIDTVFAFYDEIESALKIDGPILIDVQVNEDENCYPMVAPGKSNSQMMGIFKRNPENQNLKVQLITTAK